MTNHSNLPFPPNFTFLKPTLSNTNCPKHTVQIFHIHTRVDGSPSRKEMRNTFHARRKGSRHEIISLLNPYSSHLLRLCSCFLLLLRTMLLAPPRPIIKPWPN